MFENKSILITGGTGSFGRGLTEYILRNFSPKKLIVFSRDEVKQSQMRQALGDDDRLRFFIGDVRDLPRLQRAFRGVDIVIHAAALKQVHTLEYNPFEAVQTNIIGSKNVIDAAIDQNVEKVLLISTDKAVQPVNLYGATKLCAEKLFVDGNAYSSGRTKLSCVRYGNVLGSRGSVVELLLKNRDIAKVQITDERMTRFWITLAQSFDLVLFALQNMAGGEVVIPKIPSMRLIDLFEVLAPNAERLIVGIRPGEKIHETLLTSEEARHTVELEKYFVILPENRELFDLPNRFAWILQSGKKPSDDFVFASHNNGEWLTKENLKIIIDKIKL